MDANYKVDLTWTSVSVPASGPFDMPKPEPGSGYGITVWGLGRKEICVPVYVGMTWTGFGDTYGLSVAGFKEVNASARAVWFGNAQFRNLDNDTAYVRPKKRQEILEDVEQWMILEWEPGLTMHKRGGGTIAHELEVTHAGESPPFDSLPRRIHAEELRLSLTLRD